MGPSSDRDRAVTAEEELTDDLKLAIQDSNYSMANLANQLESIEGLVRMLCHVSLLNIFRNMAAGAGAVEILIANPCYLENGTEH
jgi:hypothetical protein